MSSSLETMFRRVEKEDNARTNALIFGGVSFVLVLGYLILGGISGDWHWWQIGLWAFIGWQSFDNAACHKQVRDLLRISLGVKR